nr:DUF4968 domain-containing protein [Ktedonobacter sp. SOSP1-52]
MEMATPATTSAHLISLSPLGYHVLGTASMLETTTSKVCLRAGSAIVEVTALAPDLFRVGFFPHGRPASYSSEAVVSRDWEPGPVAIREGEGEVTIATSVATAHLSLDPLRIGFTDQAGRAFATDDPELGMGWLTPSRHHLSIWSIRSPSLAHPRVSISGINPERATLVVASAQANWRKQGRTSSSGILIHRVVILPCKITCMSRFPLPW